MCVRQAEDDPEVGPFLPPRGSGNGSQVARLGRKHLYPLNQLSGKSAIDVMLDSLETL